MNTAARCGASKVKNLNPRQSGARKVNWFGEYLLAGKPAFWRERDYEQILGHLRI
jgi:hypothetical protein